jgi:hypothetical protein
MIRTRCCCCNQELAFTPSAAMRSGTNSAWLICPTCQQYLHAEVLEGNEAWTEKLSAYVDREKYGPSGVAQLAEVILDNGDAVQVMPVQWDQPPRRVPGPPNPPKGKHPGECG